MKDVNLEKIELGRDDIDNVLASLTPEQIDALPFGAIQVDEQGTVVSYSRAEAAITGRNPKDVIGKNFFTEVAPCTKRPEFHGRFLEGVKRRRISVVFDYTFDYKMNPTRVRVHMKKAVAGDNYWILVSRL